MLEEDGAVGDRQVQGGEEQVGREPDGEVADQVAAALRAQLVDELVAAAQHERLQPPDRRRGEPAVQHPAHRGVLRRVEVLGEQVERVLRGQRADDLVAEHVGQLQRLEHVLVIGDHPERPGAGVVPQERAPLALGVEQFVGLEQRPLDGVVGMADGTAAGRHDLSF
jgi:hypothetical protein